MNNSVDEILSWNRQALVKSLACFEIEFDFEANDDELQAILYSYANSIPNFLSISELAVHFGVHHEIVSSLIESENGIITMSIIQQLSEICGFGDFICSNIMTALILVQLSLYILQ